MKTISINPQKFAKIVSVWNFKDWVLKTYKHAWHTLSNSTLQEALVEYNKIHKLKCTKFWD